jgi:hypothetical protein
MSVNYRTLVVAAMLLANWRVAAQTLSEEAEQKARDLLRVTVQARETSKAAPTHSATPTPPPAAPQERGTAPTAKAGRPLNYAELEQAYLAGRISARQFQRYLETGTQPQLPTASATSATRPRPSAAPNVMPPTPTLEPATTANTEAKVEDSGAATITEVEKKMDELLRLKAERERAEEKSALSTTNPLTGKLKTKREQMDDLLKLYVAGKISEADYKAKRDVLLK